MFNRLSSFNNRTVLLILICVALLSGGASLLVNQTKAHANSAEWLDSLLQNFCTEMLGALVTFGLINIALGRRDKNLEEEKATQKEKERLKRELGSSSVNDVAKRAAEELTANKWLRDGTTLPGVVLTGAKLEGASLNGATLQGANLQHANLQRVGLDLANLQEAEMGHAKLQWAFLRLANLQRSKLQNANLQNTELIGAELQGADLRGANLQDADLTDTQFDEETTLPDGTRWTSKTYMARFTDPDHPQFWRSDNPTSPAYGGKAEG